MSDEIYDYSDEDEGLDELQEVLQEERVRSPKRRPGRPKGCTQVPYLPEDFNAALECFLQLSPQNVSGAYFLNALQKVMPSKRTTVALQSFVSGPFRAKIRDLVNAKYGHNLKTLTLSQNMALRIFLSGTEKGRKVGAIGRRQKAPLNANQRKPFPALPCKKPMMALAWKDTVFEEPAAQKAMILPSQDTVICELAQQPPAILVRKPEPVNVPVQTGPSKKAIESEEDLPASVGEPSPLSKSEIQQLIAEAVKSACKNILESSFSAPVTCGTGASFLPTVTSTPLKVGVEEKVAEEKSDQDCEVDHELDATFMHALETCIPTDSGLEVSEKDSFLESRMRAKISNVTVIELFTQGAYKKKSSPKSSFYVKHGDDSFEIRHSSTLGLDTCSTEGVAGHASDLSEATGEVKIMDILSNNVDLAHMTIKEDPQKKDLSFQVGSVESGGKEYPVFIIRRK